MLLGLAIPDHRARKSPKILFTVQNWTLKTSLQRSPPKRAGGAYSNPIQSPALAVRKDPFYYRTARLA